MVDPRSAHEKPTSIAVRAPHTRRENMSRPNSSVPSQCALSGADSIAMKSLSSGS